MKCFFIGFVGAVLGLVLSMVAGSQYADYMAAAQTSHWLNEAAPTVKQVTKNIERLHGISGAGLGVLPPVFPAKPPPPAMTLVTGDGVILLQGGYKGQAVMLVPAWKDDKVAWRCMGGSRPDTSPCEHWQPDLR